MPDKRKIRRTIYYSGIILLIFLGSACNSSKKINTDFLYFQRGLDSMGAAQLKESVIKVNDLLNIQITSKSLNQDQTMLFNVPNNSGGSNAQGYLVSMSGNIEVPVIGNIKAAGLTKDQLQSLLTEKLTPYVRDPFVIIKFSQFNINVLGEVKAPGTHNFSTERVTILDAISASGDLTDFGKRQDVLVIREENGKQQNYKVDLRSGSLFQSPVFLMQHNDIVYVGANDFKLKNLKVNPNTQQSLQIFFSLLSVASTITYLIINIARSK